MLEQNQKILKTAHARLEKEKIKLKNCTKIVDIVHPVNTLKRGFSITRRPDGQIVRDVSDVKETDQITTHLAAGNITSEVKLINREKSSG